MPMPFLKRKFLALSWLSNLAIRLETGRYERPRLEEHQRLCKACRDGISVENEIHIYFQYGLYHDLRRFWMSKLNVPANFHELPENELPENVKATAQYIIDAFNKRSKIVNA